MRHDGGLFTGTGKRECERAGLQQFEEALVTQCRAERAAVVRRLSPQNWDRKERTLSSSADCSAGISASSSDTRTAMAARRAGSALQQGRGGVGQVQLVRAGQQHSAAAATGQLRQAKRGCRLTLMHSPAQLQPQHSMRSNAPQASSGC